MITSLVYRDHRLVGQNVPVETLAALREEAGVLVWVDLAEPTDEEIKLILDSTFHFHPLAIEDCVSDAPFPKIEPYEDCLHLVMHAVDYEEEAEFKTTELDFFLGANFLVTFHRVPLKIIDTSRERFAKNPGTLVRGPDRFAHTILDCMVDAYKPALALLGEHVENIAEGVISHISADELFSQVVTTRKQLSKLRQIVRPQRAVAAELAQGKTRFIRKLILPYLRDLEEELGRIESQATTWGDQLIVTFRIFLNKSSHEANAGIRVMTAITALTFPIILVGGWYGMNFLDYMPELKATFGYYVAAAVTVVGTLGAWLFMRHKRWL